MAKAGKVGWILQKMRSRTESSVDLWSPRLKKLKRTPIRTLKVNRH
jgi:hypothetical protein